jgi:hypothetical protein
VRISSNYGRGAEALYAADAAVERVMQDVVMVPNWDDILSGAQTSTFIDGAPGGIRILPSGLKIDLTQATNIVRCGKVLCADADLVALTDDRPWGANNPVWQLYAYAPLNQLVPTHTIDSQMYVIVWVADDPSENDDDPLHDGAPPVGCDPKKNPDCAAGNSGRGFLSMMAQALGPDGTQRTLEVTLARQGGVRILSWRADR